MNLSKRVIAAVLMCALSLCTLVPCAFAEDAPTYTYSTTQTGTVAYDESKIMNVLGSRGGDYYMESTLTCVYKNRNQTIRKEIICGHSGSDNTGSMDSGKHYAKMTYSSGDEINYYDGKDTYNILPSSLQATKDSGFFTYSLGACLEIPYKDQNPTYTTGTTTVNGVDYYSETGVENGGNFATTRIFCFDGDTLKYIICDTSYQGEPRFTYIHEVKSFSRSCDESQFILPENFPNGYTFTEY